MSESSIPSSLSSSVTPQNVNPPPPPAPAPCVFCHEACMAPWGGAIKELHPLKKKQWRGKGCHVLVSDVKTEASTLLQTFAKVPSTLLESYLTLHDFQSSHYGCERCARIASAWWGRNKEKIRLQEVILVGQIQFQNALKKGGVGNQRKKDKDTGQELKDDIVRNMTRLGHILQEMDILTEKLREISEGRKEKDEMKNKRKNNPSKFVEEEEEIVRKIRQSINWSHLPDIPTPTTPDTPISTQMRTKMIKIFPKEYVTRVDEPTPTPPPTQPSPRKRSQSRSNLNVEEVESDEVPFFKIEPEEQTLTEEDYGKWCFDDPLIKDEPPDLDDPGMDNTDELNMDDADASSHSEEDEPSPPPPPPRTRRTATLPPVRYQDGIRASSEEKEGDWFDEYTGTVLKSNSRQKKHSLTALEPVRGSQFIADCRAKALASLQSSPSFQILGPFEEVGEGRWSFQGVEIQDDESSFRCGQSDCERSFNYEAQVGDFFSPRNYLVAVNAVRDHIMTQHKGGYICDLCPPGRDPHHHARLTPTGAYPTFQKLFRHRAWVHDRAECEICAKPGISTKSLPHHLWSHKNEEEQAAAIFAGEEAPLKPKPWKKKASFQCEKCGKVLNSRGSLESHEASVHAAREREKVPCSSCGKMLFPHNLAVHEQSAHARHTMRTYGCAQSGCRRTFITRTLLRKHVERAHTLRERAFGCGDCSKRFYTEKDLRKHEATHLDASLREMFACAECGRMFTDKKNLKRHVVTLHRQDKSN